MKQLGLANWMYFSDEGKPVHYDTWPDLWMAGYLAALGLTVALFVASAAFVDPELLGEAKMGALLSGGVGLSAIALARSRRASRLSGH